MLGQTSNTSSQHSSKANPIAFSPKEPQGLTEISLNDYKPRRFGLKYNPPTIVLEYLVPSNGKLYHHKMRAHHLEKHSNIKEVATAIIKKHSKYFNHTRVSPQQIEMLVAKLYEHEFGAIDKPQIKEEMKAKESADVSKAASRAPKIDYNKFDLNKLNDEELDEHKRRMDETFNKHHIDPKDERFKYDIEVEFKPQPGNTEWDDDADDDF